MSRQSVDHGAAGVLQHLGVVDVVLFIEPGTQFQQTQDVLALVRGIGQCRRDLAGAGQTVQGDLDGQHVRIVRRFVEQIHKGHDALEREAQEQILLLDVRDILALLQSQIAVGPALLVLHLRCRLDAGTEGQIKGRVGHKDAVFRQSQIAHQIFLHRCGQLAVDLETDRKFGLALFQHVLHLLPGVAVHGIGLLLQEYVGVARDFDDGFAPHVLLLVQKGHEVAHQTFRQHDLLPSVDLKGDVRRDPLQRHQDHLHVGAPAFRGDDIGLPVPQEGQFLVEVQDLRRQLVLDVAEHLLAHQFVHLGHLPEIHDVDAGFDELALQFFPDAVGHGALLRHLLLDMDDLLGRGPSGDGIDHVRSQLGAVGQDAHAHPVELVQVGLVDGQELQPFQQRNAGVRRLHQHPEVKFQPAHFPVHIEPVRRWFGLFIGAVLFLLVSHVTWSPCSAVLHRLFPVHPQ